MTASSHTSTVLIVDDAPANLGVIVESLEDRGLRVVVAQRGAEALQRAEYVRPDLILLDVMMPDLHGFEICRRLKVQPGTRDIPVIFMTSLASIEDKMTGFGVGGVDYVTKPLQVEEVRARVETHLSLRAMRRQLEQQNAQLQLHQEELERQVAQRTAELSDANRQLRTEIEERRRAEENVRALNADLERRVAERTAQLEETNEELEAFSYSVSHDLRAPLRAINGYAQVVIEDHGASLPAKALEHLSHIVRAGHRMEVLIRDLLNYARTGRGALHAAPAPLAPLVQQIEATFSARFAAVGGRLDVIEPLATPIGDATLIGQILTNLVDNALKYRRLDVALTVALTAKVAGEHVLLQVADNGVGVAPENRERIFEMFQRAHSDREHPGAGIGLALVVKAARAMGGDVSIESTPGQGSAFTVRLPAAAEPSSDA